MLHSHAGLPLFAIILSQVSDQRKPSLQDCIARHGVCADLPQMSRRESLRLYCQRLEKPQACSANRLNHVKSQPSQEPACASQISCMDADPRVSAFPARFRPFSEGATRVAGLVRDRFDGTSLCKRGSYMFAQEQSGVEDWYPAAGALRQANPRSIGPCPETLCRTLNPKP